MVLTERIQDYRQEARDQLQRYLHILERQNEAIQNHDSDALEFYLQEGRETLSALHAVQKVVASAGETMPDGDGLMDRVRRLHQENRSLLVLRRDELGRRISEVNVPHRARSVFQPATHGGSMVDVSM